MNKKLYNMLKLSAEADKAKALLTLELLTKHAAGIGDHSTGDFYDNAEEAKNNLLTDPIVEPSEIDSMYFLGYICVTKGII